MWALTYLSESDLKDFVRDVPDFPNTSSDLNLLFTNLDAYGDRNRVSAAGKRNWSAGDVIKVTIHNDENFTRFFRVVDFGTTDYQFGGTDMGLLDWKPVWGMPQIAAGAWQTLFFGQGFGETFWSGTAVGDMGGNPFYVDPAEDDPAGFWPAGERDLFHPLSDITGFSGPGFHNVVGGEFTVWGNNYPDSYNDNVCDNVFLRQTFATCAKTREGQKCNKISVKMRSSEKDR